MSLKCHCSVTVVSQYIHCICHTQPLIHALTFSHIVLNDPLPSRLLPLICLLLCLNTLPYSEYLPYCSSCKLMWWLQYMLWQRTHPTTLYTTENLICHPALTENTTLRWLTCCLLITLHVTNSFTWHWNFKQVTKNIDSFECNSQFKSTLHMWVYCQRKKMFETAESDVKFTPEGLQQQSKCCVK